MVRKSIWKALFGTTQPRTTRRPSLGSSRLELLETRVTPAVNITQSAGVLTITGDNASDVITITEQTAQGSYRVVSTESGGVGNPTTQDFTGVTSIDVRTGGGDGDDVVNFVAAGNENNTGLTGALSISGAGNSLAVNIGASALTGGTTGTGDVDVRGTTTIAFSGDESLTVNVSGTTSGGTVAAGSTGVRLGALTINSTGAAADSTITIGRQTRLAGALRVNTTGGDDVVTIDRVSIRGGVIINAGTGDNDVTVTDTAAAGGITVTGQQSGAGASAAADIDLSITGSTFNGNVVSDLTGSAGVGAFSLVGSTVTGGIFVRGGSDADVVTISGTSIGAGVTLTLREGAANASGGAAAGSTVTITDFTRIGGDLTQTGSGNLAFTMDADSVVTGNVSLSATGGTDASTVTLGGAATLDNPLTVGTDESAPASGAYIGGSFTFNGGDGTEAVTFTNANVGAVTLSLGGNGGGTTSGQTSSIALTNSLIRGALTQTGIANNNLTYTQAGGTRVMGPVSLDARGASSVNVTVSGASSIDGFLSVYGGSGADTVTLDGSGGIIVLRGQLSLALGDGTAAVTVTSAEIRDAFVMSAFGNATVDLTRVRVVGTMSAFTFSGNDTFSLDDVTVTGAVTLSTRENDDVVEILNSDFHSTVSLNTGSGADTVNIEAGGIGASDTGGRDTVFRGGFSLLGGTGTDTIVLGTDESNEAVFLSTVSFNGDADAAGDNSGGAADDTIDDAFAEYLGSQPTFSNFNRI